MSGIAGLLHLDGSPVDVTLLRRMTGTLAFRGPDAQDVWTSGPVGFGHTLLRTMDESAREHQPLSFDGQVWITADARVDARAELVAKLGAAGRCAVLTAPDVELILHAYHAWGEDCVQHLLGDFSFAIWDAPQRKLFCARDHFGVKPFFYAQIGNVLVFSNTLDCVRLHPAVSGRLDDLFIADFLLFAMSQDVERTAFADVRRLAPAHTLICAAGAASTRRYWTLPTDGYIRYKKDRDYIEHFWNLFQQAVRDRVRSNHAVVSMSGGLDSPAVAAVAKQSLAERFSEFDLRAFTFVFEQLIPDREGHYAGLVANILGIPIQFIRLEEREPFDEWLSRECQTREPLLEPYSAFTRTTYEQIAASRVLLTGYGGDPLMCPPVAHVIRLTRHFRVGPLLSGFARYWWRYRRKPPLGGMRQRLRTWFGVAAETPEFPDWLNQSFVARLGLVERWQQTNRPPPSLPSSCQEACRAMVANFWSFTFEAQDAGSTGQPVEVWHPFFDLRLVHYVLSIPPIPWFWDKMLLREAIRRVLPEEIRQRPKSPLVGDPVANYLRMQPRHWVDWFVPVAGFSEYVVRDKIPQIAGSERSSKWWLHLRPLALNLWLQRLSVLRPPSKT